MNEPKKDYEDEEVVGYIGCLSFIIQVPLYLVVLFSVVGLAIWTNSIWLFATVFFTGVLLLVKWSIGRLNDTAYEMWKDGKL